MSHRPVLIPLILAAMLIAGSWVGRSVIAQEPSAQPRTASEVALDLAQPEVLEQIRAELWGKRSSVSVLQAIPSPDAMTLAPVVRPIYQLRRDFWTGQARLVPRYEENQPRLMKLVLVSHGGKDLATAWVNIVVSGLNTRYDVYSVTQDSLVARSLLEMKPEEKLVAPWSGKFTQEPWRFDGEKLVYTDRFPDGLPIGSRTPTLQAAVETPTFEGDPSFVVAMIPITALAFLFLFPWKRARYLADHGDQEH
jgi:hypothetical protein